MSVSSAYYLNWTTPIVQGSVGAGYLFSTQPVLLLTDYYGDAETGQVVSLFLYYDMYCTVAAGNVGLVGNSSVTNASGYANFSNFRATSAGVYYVQASASSTANSSCSNSTLSVTPLLAGNVAHVNIDIPVASDSSTGIIPSTSLLITDIYGNVVSGKLVTVDLYSDGNCTLRSSSAVISGNTATSNSSGYATFQALKISTSGTYYIGAAIEGVQIQCSSKPILIVAAEVVSKSAVIVIGTAVGGIFIISVTVACRLLKLWPFNSPRIRAQQYEQPIVPKLQSL